MSSWSLGGSLVMIIHRDTARVRVVHRGTARRHVPVEWVGGIVVEELVIRLSLDVLGIDGGLTGLLLVAVLDFTQSITERQAKRENLPRWSRPEAASEACSGPSAPSPTAD